MDFFVEHKSKLKGSENILKFDSNCPKCGHHSWFNGTRYAKDLNLLCRFCVDCKHMYYEYPKDKEING